MMKKIAGIFICMLLISGALVSAHSLINNQNTQGFDYHTLTVTIPVETYDIIKEKDGYQVSIENFGRLLIAGKPDLPAKIFSIAIPPGAKVLDVSFESTNSIVIPGEYFVAPNPLPRVIGAEDPVLFERDQQQYEQNYKAVYGQNNPYPESIGEVIGTGGYRKYNLVDVRIAPICYYPISGKLTYHPDITVTVHYTFPEPVFAEDIMIDNLPRTEQIAQEIILNYAQAQNWYPNHPNGREQYNYVIITLDSLVSAVAPLVDWETAKGKSVKVVTTSWISTNYAGYDLAAKMREFLRDKYPSGEWGIEDVCLIGGYSDVPMRRTAQTTGYGQPDTDYYYAELSLPDSQSWDANGNHQYGENSDPIDFTAEVNVGRIPWSDAVTVQSICEKSVAFEQNNDDSYKKNILLIGAFFWPDTDNAVLMEYKTNPAHYPWMADWTKTRLYEDAQSSYPCDYDLNYNNVKSVWSQGTYAFVNWAGHGSPTACYEYYPSTPFVDTATCPYLNDEYPAIIFADACSNSDTVTVNIGQAMLKQGAVGFLGATKVAYGKPGWNHAYHGSSQSLDCFFTKCVTSGDYTQGAAHQWSLREMYVNNLWYYTKYEMFQWGALWGNPDLTLAPVTTSNPPSQPTKPDGNEIGVWHHEYSYTSSSTDPDGDQISYLFVWGDGSNSGWLGPYPSGTTATASHIWTELGNYSVTVKARDVWGATSPISDPLLVTITDNTPPNTPTITGPTSIKPFVSYTYTFSGTDDQDQDLLYEIDWGDGNGAAGVGPYQSGEEFTMTHTWKSKGTFVIRTRTTDTAGARSDWATIEIAAPFEYRFSLHMFIEQLFEMFPRMFPLLRFILGN
jgi:hypothetical protein